MDPTIRIDPYLRGLIIRHRKALLGIQSANAALQAAGTGEPFAAAAADFQAALRESDVASAMLARAIAVAAPTWPDVEGGS